MLFSKSPLIQEFPWSFFARTPSPERVTQRPDLLLDLAPNVGDWYLFRTSASFWEVVSGIPLTYWDFSGIFVVKCWKLHKINWCGYQTLYKVLKPRIRIVILISWRCPMSCFERTQPQSSAVVDLSNPFWGVIVSNLFTPSNRSSSLILHMLTHLTIVII